MMIFAILISTIIGLLVSYPIKRIVKYLIGKLEMSQRSIALVTFIISLLLSVVITFPVYGVTQQWGLIILGLVISLLLWLYIDLLSLKDRSTLLNFLSNQLFRFFLGFVIFFLVLSVTINLFPLFDRYHIISLLISTFYVSVIFIKPKRWKKTASFIKSQ